MTQPAPTPTPHKSPARIVIDGRLMYYRKAGITQYTRRLVQALSHYFAGRDGTGGGGDGDGDRDSCTDAWPGRVLCVALDRRDDDTAWLPPNVTVLRTVTPAHHPYEHLTLPLELAARSVALLHSPDFITARGRFKKVITVHDLYFLEHPEAMSTDGARYYSRIDWSARTADRIIAVSHFTRAEILRLMPGIPPDKIAVVHEAATPEPSVALPQSPISNLHSPYALFVGTFEPRKNLITLLRALRGVPEDFRLAIVGENGWVPGGEPERIAAEAGVSERVIFAGRVSDAQLDTWYRGARLLALPSLCEGFGLPLLEAMQRGIPAVCSNAGALPEVAGSAALLHDPCDVEALSRALTRLWVDGQLRAELASRGRERARAFSWARAARQTLAVYRNA